MSVMMGRSVDLQYKYANYFRGVIKVGSGGHVLDFFAHHFDEFLTADFHQRQIRVLRR